MGCSLDFYTFYISKDLSFLQHGDKTACCTFLDVKTRGNEVCIIIIVLGQLRCKVTHLLVHASTLTDCTNTTLSEGHC